MRRARSPRLEAAQQALIRHALTLAYGDLVDYATMSTLTGLPRQGLSALVKRANHAVLLPIHQRMLIVERGRGYRRASEQEVVAHADSRRKRGRRQHVWGSAEIDGIDLSRLPPEDRTRAAGILQRTTQAAADAHWNNQRAITHQQQALVFQRKTRQDLERVRHLFEELKGFFD